MSFTKKQIKEKIIEPIQKILDEAIIDNDLSGMMNCLNCCITICEEFKDKDEEVSKIWNEIVNDTISVIYSCISGFYHSANIGLRTILELACGSFYYYDHKIEYYLFQNHNHQANKYVSALVNEYHFYKSDYIRSFYKDINDIEKEEDIIANKLKSIYSTLCDVVHGRYRTLTKTEGLNIYYNKSDFKVVERNFYEVMSIIAIMFILRFNYKKDKELVDLANKSKIGVFLSE